jgi:predicted DNA-binding ribbon-helix-helix protein
MYKIPYAGAGRGAPRVKVPMRFTPFVASPVTKRSVTIGDRHTSVSLEEEFWVILRKIAREENLTIQELVSSVELHNRLGNRSSRLRIFVLRWLQGEGKE